MKFERPSEPPGRSAIAPRLDDWNGLARDGEKLDYIPTTLGPADHMGAPASDPSQVEAPGIDPGGMSLVSRLTWRVSRDTISSALRGHDLFRTPPVELCSTPSARGMGP